MVVGITAATEDDDCSEGMLSRGVSGCCCSKVDSTCVPMEVALSCSARFKASWIRLIVSFPWGDPVVVLIGAADRQESPECVRLRPDQIFRMLEPAPSWLRLRSRR